MPKYLQVADSMPKKKGSTSAAGIRRRNIPQRFTILFYLYPFPAC